MTAESVHGPTQIKDALKTTFIQLAATFASGMSGLSTGLRGLDGLICGLEAGDLVVIGGRTGMGKTALATGIAIACAKEQAKRVLYVSLEQTQLQFARRAISMIARVPLESLRSGRLAEHEMSNTTHATGELADIGLFVDDRPHLRVTDVEQACHQVSADLIVVDHIQLMKGREGAAKREEELADIAVRLKALAMSVEIPVIVVSQLNRRLEARTDKRPLLEDVRGSGTIEESADVVVLVYRASVYDENHEYPNRAELIVAKNRRGRTGTAMAEFDHRTVSFSEWVPTEGEG